MKKFSPWLPALAGGAGILAFGAMTALRAMKTHAAASTLLATARPQPRATPVRTAFESDLDALAGSLDSLGSFLERNDSARARMALYASRTQFKRMEYLIAYYSPTAATTLLGPAESDDPDLPPPPLGEPAGLVAIERALDENGSARAESRSAPELGAAVRSLRGGTRFLDVSDSATLDAARLELARVMTTGIAGVDGEHTDSAIVESAAALDGVRRGVSLLASEAGRPVDSLRTRALSLLADAAAYLRAEPRYEQFDRLTFIAAKATPAARAVLALRQAIDSTTPAARRLWRPQAATPYERDAFDVQALAPEYAPAPTPTLVARGRALFFDTRLSSSGARSCASCHQPSRAFTDGAARAAAIDRGTHGTLRNTPTLINAALQPSMFADQRAGFVEDQVRAVLSSASEMGSSVESAAERVGMHERDLRVALATYIRSLTALDSRFDRAARGDTAAMTAPERRGFNLFMGKARCGSCHFAPLFGGTLPPEFTRSELEIIGTPRTPVASNARVDPDSGRAAVDHAPAHLFAFRVPSLRNAALTAPYMHNGAYRTLDDVLDFYDRGGGVGIGEVLPVQTLDGRPLHLTTRERADIVAFLGALTDTNVVVAKP